MLVLFSAVYLSGATFADDVSSSRGAELLSPFKRDLKQALVSGLEEGAVNAINVCKVQAPAIAHRLSNDDVKMGRASHRLRNPANQSPGWINEILKDYLRSESERDPVVAALPNARTGYAEPIVAQPLCLTCHGKVLAPDVANRIKESYPDDQATGFEVGDLRGVYWVEFPEGSDDDGS